MEERQRHHRRDKAKGKESPKVEAIPGREQVSYGQVKSNLQHSEGECEQRQRAALRKEETEQTERKYEKQKASRHHDQAYYKVRDTFDDTGYHRNPADDTSTLSDMLVIGKEPRQREPCASREELDPKVKHSTHQEMPAPNRDRKNQENSRGRISEKKSAPPHTETKRSAAKTEPSSPRRAQNPIVDTSPKPVARSSDTKERSKRASRKAEGKPKESKEDRRERKLNEKQRKAEANMALARAPAPAAAVPSRNAKELSAKMYKARLCFSDSEIDTLGKALSRSKAMQQRHRDHRNRKDIQDKSKTKIKRQRRNEEGKLQSTENTTQSSKHTSATTDQNEKIARKESTSPETDALYNVLLKAIDQPNLGVAPIGIPCKAQVDIDLATMQDCESYCDELSKGGKNTVSISTATQTKLTRMLFQRVRELLAEVGTLTKERRDLQDKLLAKENEISKLRSFEEHQREREKKLTERLEILADDITVTTKGSSFNQKVQLILREVQNKYCDQWKEHEDRMKRVQDEAEQEIQGLMRDIVSKYAEISEIRCRSENTVTLAPYHKDEGRKLGHEASDPAISKVGDYRNGFQQPQLAGMKNTNQLLLKIAQPLKPLSIEIAEADTEQSAPYAVPGQSQNKNGNELAGNETTEKVRPFYQPLSLKMDAKEFWRHRLLQPVDQGSSDVLKPIGVLNKSVLPPIALPNLNLTDGDASKLNSKRMAV